MAIWKILGVGLQPRSPLPRMPMGYSTLAKALIKAINNFDFDCGNVSTEVKFGLYTRSIWILSIHSHLFNPLKTSPEYTRAGV